MSLTAEDVESAEGKKGGFRVLFAAVFARFVCLPLRLLASPRLSAFSAVDSCFQRLALSARLAFISADSASISGSFPTAPASALSVLSAVFLFPDPGDRDRLAEFVYRFREFRAAPRLR